MADKQFPCQLCSCSYQGLDALKKHIRNKHPDNNASELTKDLKDKKEQCPYCKIWYVRVDHHKFVCSEKPQLNPPKGERTRKQSNVCAAGAAETPSNLGTIPKTSRPGKSSSRSSMQETEDDNAMIPELLEKLRVFCRTTMGGNLHENSVKNYESAIRTFFRRLVKKHDIFAPSRVMNIAQAKKGQYISLPNPLEYVDYDWPNVEKQASSRMLFFNAFIKLCDYLICELDKEVDGFDSFDDWQRRKHWIEKQRNNAGREDKNLQKVATVYREEQLQNQRTLEDKEPEVPEKVIEMCLKKYLESEKRAEFLKKLEKAMKPFSFLHNPETIRDFLHLEVFLHGAGARPDSIRNMRFYDFIRPIETENKKSCVILIPEHKTAKYFGSQKIIVPKMLYDLILKFCDEIYADNFKKTQWKAAKTEADREKCKTIQSEDYIFASQNGKPMDRTDRLITLWKRFVPEEFEGWNVTPYDYRRYCETKYQSSEDHDVRENAPETIGHSRATAKKNYEMQSRKIQKQENYKNVILGHDQFYDKEQNDDTPVATSSRASQLKQLHMEDLREKNRQMKQQQEEQSFKETQHKRLKPSERDVLRATFDRYNQPTLHLDQINDALKTSKEFATVFAEVKKRTNQDERRVKEILKSSYRAIHRNQKK